MWRVVAGDAGNDASSRKILWDVLQLPPGDVGSQQVLQGCVEVPRVYRHWWNVKLVGVQLFALDYVCRFLVKTKHCKFCFFKNLIQYHLWFSPYSGLLVCYDIRTTMMSLMWYFPSEMGIWLWTLWLRV